VEKFLKRVTAQNRYGLSKTTGKRIPPENAEAKNRTLENFIGPRTVLLSNIKTPKKQGEVQCNERLMEAESRLVGFRSSNKRDRAIALAR